MKLTVTKEQARRFLLQKQLLIEKPKEGDAGIKHVFEKLRIIQYDPLNPCGRNPDLVLQTRVENYHPEDYFKWLYKEKNGIECYDKLLCIIPIEDFPLTSHNRKIVVQWPQFKELLKKRQKDFEIVLNFIDKNGPVSSSDIENQEIVPGLGWYGFGSRWGKVALELLWKTGRIVIAKRIKGNKYYDLPRKVYNGDYFGIDREVEEEHVLRRVNAVGILRATSTGGAWNGLGRAKHVSEILKSLINKRELTLLNIEGIKTKYVVLTKNIKLFDTKVSFRDEMLFIAPLDSFVWDRGMLEELFGFRYRWEVYVPVAKREYGYYVLPILHKDQFVGRIEPVLQGDTLVIKNLWKEQNIAWDKGMDKGLEKAIEKFAKYLKAKNVLPRPQVRSSIHLSRIREEVV